MTRGFVEGSIRGGATAVVIYGIGKAISAMMQPDGNNGGRTGDPGDRVVGGRQDAGNYRKTSSLDVDVSDRRTFYDGFEYGDLLENYKEKYPVEYSIFEEYAKNTVMLSRDFRVFELTWRNCDAYARAESLALLDAGAADLLANVYGPQNVLPYIGGK